VLVMHLVQVLVLLCQVGVSLVLLVLLVDREKEEILQMPSFVEGDDPAVQDGDGDGDGDGDERSGKR